MKIYDLRPNRPKTQDGTFLKLHLHVYSDDVHEILEKTRPAVTCWLKGIDTHLQQTIVRAIADRNE